MKESTFADRLRALIERDSMSYRELEEKTGITEVTLSRVLHGDRPLSAPNIVKIANAFGIDVRYFFCEEEEKDMYLKKDGKEPTKNEDLKQAIKDTGDKPDQMVMKAICFDFLSNMYANGRPEKEIMIALGLMDDLIDGLSKTVKDM